MSATTITDPERGQTVPKLLLKRFIYSDWIIPTATLKKIEMRKLYFEFQYPLTQFLPGHTSTSATIYKEAVQTWVQILSLPLTSCVTLCNLLNFSVPHP